ncbi:bifunctional phosphopantothenoylcysteine decarboxylase/phosphopantothenate--cysteine ligase CoaBC [Desulfoluna butyratoxydans]|uniref:Coenzyme A biosynthesis bifunctional protein CoaBC n=1 Tax=Desulfoluna butyratoxydans TaxID=231438 RepID=A0A4U8YUP9_9BACT|nr:bifunctional phosphopantothenoylcysteine decarboxylase/phosphopantothenate--cysteine ligase CoaBC [Desulfoluna butyratoxydans]VFQ47307.1 dna / pantothenate metabolism flavoprotein [Desulfoluna butyratoxydans]
MAVLENKNVLVCVTAGIAAYKAVEVVRLLQKEGADVWVTMTRGAKEFVGETTFAAISGHPVLSNLFDEGKGASIGHIELAERADVVVVAPATADVIGKLAHGIADDAVTTTMLAVTAPKLICPAMNSHMYENRAVQRNIDILEGDGYILVEPGVGEMACGTTGPGRLAEPPTIVDRVKAALYPKDLSGKKIMVSAGPTREAIDPVRYISNRSSGKMGYEIARAAEYRGAEVTLVSGPVSLASPLGVDRLSVTSVGEMAETIFSRLDDVDAVIKVAAVADYRPRTRAEHKIKKKSDDMTLELDKNIDILKELGKRKTRQVLVGFAAETQSLAENARKKIEAKNLDMIVGNLVGDPASGFGTDTNIVTFFHPDGRKEPFESMGKDVVAHELLNRVSGLLKERL